LSECLRRISFRPRERIEKKEVGKEIDDYFREKNIMFSSLKSRSAIILILSVAFLGCRKDSEESCDTQTRTIKVAALLSKTGEWSNLGITSEAALAIGVQEINQDFENRGLPYRFELSVFDTQLIPSIALDNMNYLASNGFRLVIGPQSSSELADVKSIADSLGILVVSQGSTASSLAISGDALYRYVPGDQIEGAAMANTMISSGKQALVTLARNDVGNVGLQNSLNTNFSNLGGIVVSAGTYDPLTTDYSAALTAVKNQIIQFSSTYTNNEIAVYLASFDEAVALFNQASGDPVLSSVMWYGGDGFIKNQALLNDPLAAQFAFATSFFSPEFGLPASAQNVWSPLLTSIFNTCGLEADAFTLSAYDALKVMAKVVEQNEGIPATGSSLFNSFMTLSNTHTGATGSIALNANGDRANGSFNYWGLAFANGVYTWSLVGQSE
jgi:branched-chain amino acid transport system substrate-binding protein